MVFIYFFLNRSLFVFFLYGVELGFGGRGSLLLIDRKRDKEGALEVGREILRGYLEWKVSDFR